MNLTTSIYKPLLLTGAACCAAGCAQKAAAPKRYNIVYIMTDDHTQQMISCYNKRFAHTPNIDRIAENGVKFTSSFVANSISGPSRACLMTGKHSHKNGKVNNDHHFDGTQQTMPKLLQAAGYQTAMIGKWHLGGTPQGFDFWEILPGQGDYYQPDFITPKGRVRETGYVSDIITDKSINWLESRQEDKPFCLFVHHKGPHRNWMPKLSDLNAYEDSIFPFPETFFDDYSGRVAAQTAEMRIGSDHDMDLVNDNKVYTGTETSRLSGMYNVKDSLGSYGRMSAAEKEQWNAFYGPIISDFKARNLSGKELAEWKYQRYLKDYIKTAKAVDDNIGRLLDYLEKEGLMENTLIVYTSDQGFYMGEHGWFDKRFMYEESLRTPLVMQLPKDLKRRGDITEMVQNIDHAPTFLEIAGVQVPQDIQGDSYLPYLMGEKPDHVRDAIYYHYQEYPAEHAVKRHYGIRTERYKLIHFYNDVDEWEFFDLQKDSLEMNNLINDPAYAQLIEEHKVKLKALQEKYDDPIRFEYQ